MSNHKQAHAHTLMHVETRKSIQKSIRPTNTTNTSKRDLQTLAKETYKH